MKIEIKSVSSHQTSKVIACMLAVFTLPFAIIGLLGFVLSIGSGNNEANFSFIFFIFVPLIYGLVSYLFNRFFCFAYNIIAKRVGGIEFTTVEKE